MAIKITRVSPEEIQKRRETELAKTLEVPLDNGQLPKEIYPCGELFQLLHDPEGKGPCRPLKIGRKVTCMEDSHLEVMATPLRESQYAKLGINSHPESAQEGDPAPTEEKKENP